MIKTDGKDCLYLIWEDPKERVRYIIGELCRNGGFEFKYNHDIDEAKKKGFELLTSFPEKDRLYKSDSLFLAFSARLPDPKRPDMPEILKKYDLDEYDEYNLLKSSGAKLPIDNIEFIDPIPDKILQKTSRKFYIAGQRYYCAQNEVNCEKKINVDKDEELNLVAEPNNEYDKFAVQVLNKNRQKIGYIPRYYSQKISEYLDKGNKILCKVIDINQNIDCSECVKVTLTLFP